jgi:hypothetical protein
MTYSVEKRVGLGITIGVDFSGGTSYATVVSLVDAGKVEAKADTVKTSLLSDVIHTWSKTGVDGGDLVITIAYDPLFSEYTNFQNALTLMNSAPPGFQISLPDAGTGNGSGAATEAFKAHVTGVGKELKREGFLTCDVTLKSYGNLI